MLAIFARPASKTPQAAVATWGEIARNSGLVNAEALPIFARADERLHHLRLDIITTEIVQLAEPEVEAGRIWIAAQIAKVLHGDKRRVELAVLKERELGHLPKRRGARQGRAVKPSDERVA